MLVKLFCLVPVNTLLLKLQQTMGYVVKRKAMAKVPLSIE
jgi:hypothetical protein